MNGAFCNPLGNTVVWSMKGAFHVYLSVQGNLITLQVLFAGSFLQQLTPQLFHLTHTNTPQSNTRNILHCKHDTQETAQTVSMLTHPLTLECIIPGTFLVLIFLEFFLFVFFSK